MAPPHPLELNLDPIPIGLNMLGVSASNWIHEVQRVIDSRMTCNAR